MTTIARFHQPTTLDEATALLTGASGSAKLLGGGTDLGVQVRRGLVAPTDLVSLGGIPELGRLAVSPGEVVIGSTVSHRRVEQSSRFAGTLIALREACETVGAVQTRTVGTIAGNLANASPAADTPPVLVAFRATLDIVGPDGERSVGVDEFFLDYRRTVLSANDIITAVRIPDTGGAAGSAFVKLGRRRAMEISISCAGVFVRLAEDGRCVEIGIGLGSVAATTIRAVAAESVLLGQSVTDELMRAAAAEAAAHTSPVDDIRASASYRRQVTEVLVYRALRRAVDRARSSVRGTAE
jgi:aerobic carbon-monoxide dehydrogenase medium subunit